MDADLRPIYLQIMQAAEPEDLFGAEDVVLPASMLLKYLDRKYSKLKAVTNPTGYHIPEDADAARDADTRLEHLLEVAKKRINLGLYGMPGYDKPAPSGVFKTFTVGKNTYSIGPKINSSGRVDTYEGNLVRDGQYCGEVIIALAHSPESNHFVQRESRILDILHNNEVPQWKHLPLLLDRFAAGERLGVTFRKYSGQPLAQVSMHTLHRSGVDQKHMVWMLDRALSCLGYVHRQGVIHGKLNPETLLIQAGNHNVFITDWSSAAYKPALTGQRVVTEASVFTPREIIRQSKIGPWSDIYSLGKVMIWVLGGDPATDWVPEHVAEPLRNELLHMVQGNPHKRPSDAWKLYEVFSEIKDGLWPRKFLPFDMT